MTEGENESSEMSNYVLPINSMYESWGIRAEIICKSAAACDSAFVQDKTERGNPAYMA